MIVAFCGHSKIENAEVADWLLSTCEQLIEEGADTFYLGGYGAFDRLAHQTVKKLQRTHTGLTSILVMPYLNWNVDVSEYDETIYPPLETVPLRFAISKRNLWIHWVNCCCKSEGQIVFVQNAGITVIQEKAVAISATIWYFLLQLFCTTILSVYVCIAQNARRILRHSLSYMH